MATGSEVFPFSTTDAGAGNVVKLAGNFLIASAIESIGEALALAESQGLERTQVWWSLPNGNAPPLEWIGLDAFLSAFPLVHSLTAATQQTTTTQTR